MTHDDEPTDDAFDDRLRHGFDALARAAGDPPPLPGRSDAPSPSPAHRFDRRVLAVAAVVVIIVASAVAVRLVTHDGSEQVATGSGRGSLATDTPPSWAEPVDRNTPAPAEHGKLLCPPALLDLASIDAEPALDPPPANEAMRANPWPYELTWEQDGRTVQLSYPEPIVTAGAAQETERVQLGGGRVADVTSGPQPTAVVRPYQEDDRGGGCSGYWLAVYPPEGTESTDQAEADAARDVLLEAAEAVVVHAPPGSVTVPAVVDMSQVDAQDVLARAGLVPPSPWATDPLDGRDVVAQTPAAGDRAAYGAVVTLELGAPATTTTSPLPPRVDVEALPIPTAAVVCPIQRLRIDGDFRSQPEVAFETTVEWQEPGDFGGTTVQLSWPNREYQDDENHGSRRLTVQGRPALMHDGGDGQDLVFDTGLPGACRYLQIGVYGGTLAEREPRAEALAESVTFVDPPTAAPPTVTGLTVAEAADRLARAGFIPDWGEDRALGEAPAPVPTATVTAQAVTEPGVVLLTT